MAPEGRLISGWKMNYLHRVTDAKIGHWRGLREMFRPTVASLRTESCLRHAKLL